MSLFHKSTIDQSLAELDRHHAALKKVLEGRPVDAEDLQRFSINRAAPKPSDFVWVNVDDVLDAVGFFKVAVDNLRRIKSRAIKP